MADPELTSEKNDEQAWLDDAEDHGQDRTWWECIVCPDPECCSKDSFKRSACWSFLSEYQCRCYVMQHLTHSSNHKMDEALAKTQAMLADVQERTETAADRREDKKHWERSQKAQAPQLKSQPKTSQPKQTMAPAPKTAFRHHDSSRPERPRSPRARPRSRSLRRGRGDRHDDGRGKASSKDTKDDKQDKAMLHAISGMTEVIQKLGPALERAVSGAAAGSADVAGSINTDVAIRSGLGAPPVVPYHPQEVSMQLRQAST